jgi:hypothetical protein
MSIKPLVAAASFVLLFSPLLAVADATKMCNAAQQGKCGHFCQSHKGMKACMVNLT